MDFQPWLQPIGIFSALAGCGILVHFLWMSFVVGPLKRRSSPWAPVSGAFSGLVWWGLTLAGVFHGLEASPLAEDYPKVMPLVHKGIVLGWVFLATLIAVRVADGLLKAREIEAREDFLKLRDIQTRNSLLRKLLTAGIYSIGALYAIRAVGGDVTPLLAGGTVGGIILGLALQDSLSHFFSGLFMNLDRPARVGDLIRLDDGREGFLEEIGWRYTRIRLWTDALLVIPNGKFATASVVNLNKPEHDLGVNVDALVGYSADLDLVERLALEAAREAVAEHGGEGEPKVRFRTMADGGIGFRIIVRALTPESSHALASEVLRRTHRKLREHDVPFPAAGVQPPKIT